LISDPIKLGMNCTILAGKHRDRIAKRGQTTHPKKILKDFCAQKIIFKTKQKGSYFSRDLSISSRNN